jgi:hypothetical protein
VILKYLFVKNSNVSEVLDNEEVVRVQNNRKITVKMMVQLERPVRLMHEKLMMMHIRGIFSKIIYAASVTNCGSSSASIVLKISAHHAFSLTTHMKLSYLLLYSLYSL